MKQQRNHEAHHLNENFKNELKIPSDSQITNYDGPITRNWSRGLQQNQHGGEGNQCNMQIESYANRENVKAKTYLFKKIQMMRTR